MNAWRLYTVISWMSIKSQNDDNGSKISRYQRYRIQFNETKPINWKGSVVDKSQVHKGLKTTTYTTDQLSCIKGKVDHNKLKIIGINSQHHQKAQNLQKGKKKRTENSKMLLFTEVCRL